MPLGLFSYRTLIFSIAIILSSVFMRQVLNFFLKFANRRQLSYTMAALLIIGGFTLLLLLVRKKAWYQLSLMVVMLVAVGFVSKTIPLPEERFHLLEFFLVGYLAAYDGRKRMMWQRVFFALLFSLAVPALDEGLQAFIPWRVADMKDVFYGFSGACAGVLFNCLYYPHGEA